MVPALGSNVPILTDLLSSSFVDQSFDATLRQLVESARTDAPEFRSIATDSMSLLGLNPEASRVPYAEIRQAYRLWQLKAETMGYEVGMALGGSLGSQLYWGPKPRSYSSNPNCPKEFDQIVECDGRILLHSRNGNSVSPHDERAVQDFTEILKADHRMRPEMVNRWNRDTEVTRLYTYKDLGNGVGLEFEMCLVPSHFVDPASYWRFSFTEEERQQQAFFRASMRSLGAAKKEISSEKDPENTECRWRVLSAFALKHLINNGQLDLFIRSLPAGYIDQVSKELRGPFSAPPPKLLRPLINSWLDGENPHNGRFHPECGIIRPTAAELPSAPVRERIGSMFPETVKAVPAPKFVGLADIVHRSLVRARELTEVQAPLS